MLLGDDVDHESTGLGVIRVTLHRAHSIPRSDVVGSSDAYVRISGSKDGRVLHRTRVIEDDLNPIWEETVLILVHKEDPVNNEKLQMEVWDADRWSEDDLLGSVQADIASLVRAPEVIFHRYVLFLSLCRREREREVWGRESMCAGERVIPYLL